MADAGVVLVTLDGSEFAESALRYAEVLAKATKRKLRLLSVVDTDAGGFLPRREALVARLASVGSERAERYLSRAAAKLRKAGLDVETEIAVGSPVAEILASAEREDIAVVAMATHGPSGMQRWVLGSVADKVMRLGARPILLVHPPTTEEALPPVRLRRLLVPLDGSDLAETALEPAINLALATRAGLVLVRVVPFLSTLLDWRTSHIGELSEIEDEMAAEATAGLERIRSEVPAAISTEAVVLRGAIAPAIEGYIKQQSIDLTVMTTHGRGGLSRLLLGSTAEQLVHAGVPLLLVRPPAAEPEKPNTEAAATTEPVHGNGS